MRLLTTTNLTCTYSAVLVIMLNMKMSLIQRQLTLNFPFVKSDSGNISCPVLPICQARPVPADGSRRCEAEPVCGAASVAADAPARCLRVSGRPAVHV